MGYSGLYIHTEPAVEPVTEADIQAQLNLSGDGTYVNLLIEVARRQAEQYMRRALITQTWRMMLDTWPGGASDWWEAWHTPVSDERYLYLELPWAPLQSVSNINTYDEADAATAITVNDYFLVDVYAEPGRLVLRSSESYPVDERRANKVEIIYLCGYGAAGDAVPADIRLGIMMHVAWLYEMRGDKADKSGVHSSGAAALYDTHRIQRL